MAYNTLNIEDVQGSKEPCVFKICTSCKHKKPASDIYFNKNCRKQDGLTPRCKKCLNAQAKIYRERNEEKIKITKRRIYDRDKERIGSKVKEYRENNKEKVTKSKREYRLRNLEEIKEKKKKYYQENKKERMEYYAEYQRNRLKNDSDFRLKHLLRRRVRHALRGKIKSGRTFDLIGCPSHYLRIHLEKQFKTGMSWGNYGEWHIDHIRPCASFDLSDPDQQKQCFNFKNLQPLWAYENLEKGAKWEGSV